jgi:mono/diheme cytochrome c family protein
MAALAQHADSTAKTTARGAYTAAQARRGAAIFQQVCGDCHASARFQDSTFLMGWKGRPVRDLFELIRTQMPQDNPGGLRRQEYADVLAYLFALNGLPPGDSLLPTDDAGLRRIRIEPR